MPERRGDVELKQIMKTMLICHEGAELDQTGLARWLASFSDLAGLIVVREKGARTWQRIRSEIGRSGLLGFLDVLIFRIYYRLFLRTADNRWAQQELQRLCTVYPGIPEDTQVLYVRSPNASEAEAFIRQKSPHMVIARCKTLLRKSIYSVPSFGTWVMHPGICPEYRNSHGCFWALVNNDLERVGMTLLKIDDGVDTGPVYGYYSYAYDEVNESHVVIQSRVTTENLEKLRLKLEEICRGEAHPLDTAGRKSAVWGQPRLSSYLAWKRNARKRSQKT